MASERDTLIAAARRADWQQVVLNGGPPCFWLGDDGVFCLRAERWMGHGDAHHPFVPLHELLAALTVVVPSDELIADEIRCGQCDQPIPDNGDIRCVDCLSAVKPPNERGGKVLARAIRLLHQQGHVEASDELMATGQRHKLFIPVEITEALTVVVPVHPQEKEQELATQMDSQCDSTASRTASSVAPDPTAVEAVTVGDLDNVRHMLGVECVPGGYRNYFVAGEDAIPSMERLRAAGLVVKNERYRLSSDPCYHATLEGARAIGLRALPE